MLVIEGHHGSGVQPLNEVVAEQLFTESFVGQPSFISVNALRSLC